MRLDKIAPEYEGRVRVVDRAFPLEVYGGGPPNRHVLEQEWWLAAIQESAAEFKPYNNSDWPTTTLPAFEAVWSAAQQDEAAAHRLDLLIRRSFFAGSVNIGRRDIYPGLAREAGLEVTAFNRLFESEQPRAAVLEEGRLGKEQYRVRGTPTPMKSDGTRLRHPIAFPTMEHDEIVAVRPLPCSGDSCYQAIRALFDEVLKG